MIAEMEADIYGLQVHFLSLYISFGYNFTILYDALAFGNRIPSIIRTFTRYTCSGSNIAFNDVTSDTFIWANIFELLNVINLMCIVDKREINSIPLRLCESPSLYKVNVIVEGILVLLFSLCSQLGKS